MFVDFNKVFKEKNTIYNIPDPIIKALSNELPHGLKYTLLDSETCVIVPEEGDLKITIDIDNDDLSEIDSTKDLMEFLYRSQKKLEIKSRKIKLNGHEFDVSEILKSPLRDEELIGLTRCFIVPERFPEPFDLIFNYNSGEKFYLKMQRQPLADLKKSLFKSVGLSAIELSYIIDEENHRMDMKFDLNLDKAENIQEMIEASKFSYHMISGDVKIGTIPIKANINYKFNKDNLKEIIDFWKKVEQISTVLNCSFQPKVNILRGDMKLVNDLYKSLILGEDIEELHPQMQLEIGFTEEPDIDSFKKSNIGFKFTMIQLFNLLDEEISVNCSKEITNFEINKVIKKENEKYTYVFSLEPIDTKGILEKIRYSLVE